MALQRKPYHFAGNAYCGVAAPNQSVHLVIFAFNILHTRLLGIVLVYKANAKTLIVVTEISGEKKREKDSARSI